MTMTPTEAIHKARAYFLLESHPYGCAETAFMVLKEAYGLPEPEDSTPAMVLNGGFAYSGGICGALSGAALAVGLLAGRRIPDHKQAKQSARRIISGTMEAFQANFGSANCRELIGLDIRDERQHRRFVESGIWREGCMQQIESVVSRLCLLGDELEWQRMLQQLDSHANPPVV